MAKLKSKLAILLVLIISFGVFASGCNLVEKSPEAIKKQKVAKVGGDYITRAELDEIFDPFVEQMKADPNYGANYLTSDQGKAMLLNQKKSLLDSLVEQKIFEQKGKELNLFKDENEIADEVKKSMDELIKAYNTEEEFNKKLEEAKITRPVFEKMMRGQVISQKVYEDIIKDITVSDDDVKKYYEDNKSYMTEKPNTMEVSHIVVDTEDKAKEVKARLEKGEDFAAVAKEVSTEPAAKESGGNLGEIRYNDPNYDATFVQAAMALKENALSDPVQTQWGYHIIKVTKKTEYPILELDKVKEEIKEMLLQQDQQKKYEETMTGWREKAGIKIYEENINNQK